MAKLVKQWPAFQRGGTLAVYTSPCIVTRPPPATNPSRSRALVNPANEQLIGTALPYFPMAAPPKGEKLNTSNWGALSAGPNMFYPIQTIDGILSLHGGTDLRNACNRVPVCKGAELIGGGGNKTGGFGLVRCPVGSAVTTPAFGKAVTEHYQTIVHTVPPLWPRSGGSKLTEEDAKSLLASCFYQALKVGFNSGASVVTMPLIGAGARRAPLETAIECAVEGILKTLDCSSLSKEGQFEVVILEPRNADLLVRTLDLKLDGIEIEAG